MALLLMWPASTLAQGKPKPKEVVIAVAQKAESHADLEKSADALAAKLKAGGEDVLSLRMGDETGADVPSLDKLQEYLKAKKFAPCLKSLHIVQHGEFMNGQGDNNDFGLSFPPDSSGHKVIVEKDGETNHALADGEPNQFGKAKFAALVNDLLCPDGELFLESCWSGAKPKTDSSLAQRIADESSRTVHGHTGTVLFPPGAPPTPGDGDTFVVFAPNTPAVGYRGGTSMSGGLNYCWDVTLGLSDSLCDVHIELVPGTDTKKFGNFTVTEPNGNPMDGWSGGVTDGKYFSWFTKDCAKNKRTKSFRICVDLTDPGAKDGPPTKQKVLVTKNGGQTWTPADVIKERSTDVPKFGASVERPDESEHVGRAAQETSTAIGELCDSYGRFVARSGDGRRAAVRAGLGEAAVQVDAWRGQVAAMTEDGVVSEASRHDGEALLAAQMDACRTRLDARAGAAPAPRRFFVDGGVGVAVELRIEPTRALIGIDFGVAVTPDGRGALVMPFRVMPSGDVTTVLVPVGFQWDFPLPVHGLSIFPRLAIGYAPTVFSVGSQTITNHQGVIMPAVGLRYLIRDRITVSFVPFEMPILFDAQNVGLHYDLFLSGGAVF